MSLLRAFLSLLRTLLSHLLYSDLLGLLLDFLRPGELLLTEISWLFFEDLLQLVSLLSHHLWPESLVSLLDCLLLEEEVILLVLLSLVLLHFLVDVIHIVIQFKHLTLHFL